MENKKQIDYWSKEVERLLNDERRYLATGMNEDDVQYRIIQAELKVAVDNLQYYIEKEEGE